MVSSAHTNTASRPASSRLGKTSADYGKLASQVLAPPEATDMWDWCRAHLRTYHGNKWDPDRAHIMRFWYRVAGARLNRLPDPTLPYAHLAEQVYLSLCAQIAKSTWLYAILLYCLKNTPRRIGFYITRLKDLHVVRNTRVERMLLDMPSIERQLPRGTEARERALGSHVWTVGTSLVHWLCGSVAADLRMLDLPTMLLDEFDDWPSDVDDQGDPIDLALGRQRTYGRTRLLAAASSPGLIHGHTWRRVCGGSHHRPIVLCPSCQGASWLDWRLITVVGDRKIADVHPEEITRQHLARWTCPHCGELHAAAAVRAMVRECARADRWIPGTWAIDADHPTGHWTMRAEQDKAGRLIDVPPYDGAVWSGQAGSIYSVDMSLDAVAARIAISEQGKLTQRKTITNIEHAEPWIHIITSDDQDTASIRAQAQDPSAYRSGTVPANTSGQGWLVLAFDQQGNQRSEWWFPWVLRYVLPGGDSWMVASGSAKNTDERDALSDATWTIDGKPRRPDFELIDIANGHFTFDGYLWASDSTNTRICFRGDSRLGDGVPWSEVLDQPKRRRTPRPAGVREFKIAPHHWRTKLWDRIRRHAGEPRWHLPVDPTDQYLRSLTSEEQVVERHRVPGKGWQDIIVWRPRTISTTSDEQSFRKDNHWWICEVAIAASINFLGMDIPIDPTPEPDAVDFVASLARGQRR